MNREHAFEIIHQKGTGYFLRCFLIVENDNTDDSKISLINNYKYSRGIFRIYLNFHDLQQFEKLLTLNPYCRLLIKKDESKKTLTLEVYCKFIKVENQLIHICFKKLKYTSDEGTEIIEKFQGE